MFTIHLYNHFYLSKFFFKTHKQTYMFVAENVINSFKKIKNWLLLLPTYIKNSEKEEKKNIPTEK